MKVLLVVLAATAVVLGLTALRSRTRNAEVWHEATSR